MLAHGSVDRQIVRLAVPAAGSAMLHVIHRAVDMVFVGGLGTEAVAGLSISSVSVWILASIGAFVGMGLTALVARYVGAARPEGARYVAAQGLRWSLVLGLAAGGLGWLLTPALFGAVDASAGVAAAGGGYTRVFWGGGAFLLLQQACDAVFRGHGNTRLPFVAALIALGLNIVLDPLLIYGWGPIPAMGVPGAAWATLLATALAAGLLVRMLVRLGHVGDERPSDDVLRFDPTTRVGRPRLLGLDTGVFHRIARVGFPVAAAGLFFNLIYLVLYRIAAVADGPAAQAGLGLGHTGEGVAYVLCLGWAVAASALVGQNLGAGNPAAAERAAWRAVLHAAALSALWGAVLLVFADPIAGFLTSLQPEADGGARVHAAAYFRIVSWCLAIQAVEIVLEGAFGGAGLTVPPMLITAFFSVIRIPMAILACGPLGFGADGLWWTLAITATLRGIVGGLWFARGTWKTRSV